MQRYSQTICKLLTCSDQSKLVGTVSRDLELIGSQLYASVSLFGRSHKFTMNQRLAGRTQFGTSHFVNVLVEAPDASVRVRRRVGVQSSHRLYRLCCSKRLPRQTRFVVGSRKNDATGLGHSSDHCGTGTNIPFGLPFLPRIVADLVYGATIQRRKSVPAQSRRVALIALF